MSDYNSTKYDDKERHGDASGDDLLSVGDLAKIRRARLQEAGARGAHVVSPEAEARRIAHEQEAKKEKFISVDERRKRDADILRKAGE